jgi:uncharacterized protein (TIGR03118 family)
MGLDVWRGLWANKKRAPRVRAFQPAVEVLEGRCLLSSGYLQTNLVSDIPGLARATDPNLTNPWGIAFDPGGPFWLADNVSGVSTLYDGSGQAVPLSVQVPPSGAAAGWASMPTGTVFNGGPGFRVSENGKSGPSLFLFSTEGGTIAGWNALVDGTHAIRVVDNSSAGAVYKGLALGSDTSRSFLFAANFRAGTIDVFDQSFHSVHLAGAFQDASLPAGFVPFNVQNIGGSLFVTYALKDANGHDEVYGPGRGFIDVFNTNGNLLQRLASAGNLNAPWGVTVAPSDFGAFSNDLLVGNVGDGAINAFDPATGAWLGKLTDASGNAVVIPHVWALTFGGGGSSGNPDTLFFSAGIKDEQHGLFGSLRSADHPAADTSAGPTGSYAPGETDSSPDNYPLPPPDGPALRGSGEGQALALPILFPLKGFSATLVATTLSEMNVPTGNNAVPPATAALAQNPNSGVGTFSLSSQMERPEIFSARRQALEILLAPAVETDFAEAATPVVREARSERDDAPQPVEPAAFVQFTRSAQLASNERGATDDPRVSATPEAGARSKADVDVIGPGTTRSASAGNFWLGLPLALGIYLAWFSRLILGQRPSDERRLRSI